jgi:hypothetical protein
MPEPYSEEDAVAQAQRLVAVEARRWVGGHEEACLDSNQVARTAHIQVEEDNMVFAHC